MRKHVQNLFGCTKTCDIFFNWAKKQKNPLDVVDAQNLVTTTIHNVKVSELFNAVLTHNHDKIAVF